MASILQIVLNRGIHTLKVNIFPNDINFSLLFCQSADTVSRVKTALNNILLYLGLIGSQTNSQKI